MGEYESNLMKQFKAAIGSRKFDPESKFLKEEYDHWVKDLNFSKSKYLKLLKQFRLQCDNENAIEVGKGPVDSLFLDGKTTIVSPYFKDVKERAGLTYVGKPIVTNDELKYIENDTIKPLDIQGGRIYLTQNVYDINELSKWYRLVKRDTVVVGVFGRIFDSDMSKKIIEIKEFAKQLDNYTYNYGDLGSVYCYTIVSKKK